MSVIFKASLETRHFSFEAYGSTAPVAKLVLRQALKRHALQCNPTGDAKGFASIFMRDAEVREIVMGGAYRDGEAL